MEKPEALRLADALETGDIHENAWQAAAELRRLHAENERLHAQRDALLAEHQQTLALQQRSYEREIQLEVEAEREAIIQMMPGGHSVDPQWVCDAIRARTP